MLLWHQKRRVRRTTCKDNTVQRVCRMCEHSSQIGAEQSLAYTMTQVSQSQFTNSGIACCFQHIYLPCELNGSSGVAYLHVCSFNTSATVVHRASHSLWTMSWLPRSSPEVPSSACYSGYPKTTKGPLTMVLEPSVFVSRQLQGLKSRKR